MSLLSGFNVTLPEVGLLGEAALAAFAGGVVPAGWNVITPQQLTRLRLRPTSCMGIRGGVCGLRSSLQGLPWL